MAFQQLVLPFDEAAATGPAHGIQRTRRVFVNRNLRMTGAAFIGFDMDYTLAIYDQPEMDHSVDPGDGRRSSSRAAIPSTSSTSAFDTQFPIRGLLIDKRFGHILKMDRYKVVQRGYHGMRELSKEEIRALYHSKKIRPTTSRYHWIDTLYALSEAALYAGIVDAFEKAGSRSTTHGSSPTSASASTKRTATARSSTP